MIKCVNFQKKLAIWLVLVLMIDTSINFVYALPSLNQEKTTFQLHILKKTQHQLKLHGYDKFENFWPILKNVDLSSESYFVITENDIEGYNWPDQSITLTLEASTKLLKLIFGKDGFLPKKHAWSDVELAFQFAIFVVVFEGKKLYGGVCVNPFSSGGGGGSYPIIVPQLVGVIPKPLKLQIRLVVRPIATRKGYKYLNSSLKNRIEIPKVRNFFQKLGKLTQDAAPNRVESWIPKIDPIHIKK